MVGKIESVILIIILVLIVYVSIIPDDGNGTKNDKNGTTYETCYYNDEGEEFCVEEYIPEEPDIDPYVRW